MHSHAKHHRSEALKPTHLEVINESSNHNVPKGSETHFKVVIVSDDFAGKSLLSRQRLVNLLLKEELGSGVHALSMVTKTQASPFSSLHSRFHDLLLSSRVSSKSGRRRRRWQRRLIAWAGRRNDRCRRSARVNYESIFVLFSCCCCYGSEMRYFTSDIMNISFACAHG